MATVRKTNRRGNFIDAFAMMYPEFSRDVREGHSSVKDITFVVTESCNLKCTYCYECHKNYNAIMDKDTARKAVDMILDDSMVNGYYDSKSSPGVIIEFIGGEPLLQIDLIEFVCEYFRYKAFELNHPWYKHHMFNMTTNGLLYNTPKVQKFVNKFKDRLSMTITIDGDKELHDACRIRLDGSGSYDTVVESIKTSIGQLNAKSTKVTFAPENIPYISTSIPHLFDLGLTDINANCVFEDVWKQEHAILFYKELVKLADYIIDNKIYETSFCSIFDENIGFPLDSGDTRNWCGGNGQMLAIGTDGRLFPCIRFMKYSLQNQNLPEFEIGNVDKGIDKEEDNKFLQELSSITRQSQSPEKCLTCPVAKGCAWCTGYNYDMFGTPNKRATFICWMHKSRIVANYYFWNKIYKVVGENNRFPMNLSKEEIDYITEGKGLPDV